MWQLIETAPRGGVRVVLLRLLEGRELFWVGGHSVSEHFVNGVRESQYESWGYPGMNMGDSIQPTHWMPIPPTEDL